MRMTEHAVVIAGGGPAGMMLAAELALAKVDVAVVERRPDHAVVGSRAGGFHSRTTGGRDQRGRAAWIAELPVDIYYGCEVTGFAQDDAGVGVELSAGGPLRAQYLVGCDGGRSVIRKAAGI